MAAPDFYFAINTTFRHIHRRYGEQGLRTYWQTLAREYFADVIQAFAQGGLNEVERYWREFFEIEPGGQVCVTQEDSQVVIDVAECPAIKHIKAHGREIMELYCQHCNVINTEMARGASLEFCMSGGDGACRQVFSKKEQV